MSGSDDIARITTRLASRSDASLLSDLGRRAFHAAFAEQNNDDDMAAYLDSAFGETKQAAELDDPANVFVIAEEAGAPVGYAQLRFGSAPLPVWGARPVELVRIYADPDHTGRGVGAVLMQRCLTAAAERDCDTIWLGVWQLNPRAVAFYQREGFVVVGEQDFLVGTDIQRDFVMARQVTSRNETEDQKRARVLRDTIEVVPYDPRWPELYAAEEAHLRACLPADLLGLIEHIGSTAVPGLAAKPVVDMLVAVSDPERARDVAGPILEAQGYDAFWRPTMGDDTPPFYPWFIKRGANGERTHHIHMVDAASEQWERVAFRDFLRANPDAAAGYAELKRELVSSHGDDRAAYTDAKTDFITAITRQALRERE